MASLQSLVCLAIEDLMRKCSAADDLQILLYADGGVASLHSLVCLAIEDLVRKCSAADDLQILLYADGGVASLQSLVCLAIEDLIRKWTDRVKDPGCRNLISLTQDQQVCNAPQCMDVT